jgi:small membrane protein
MIIQFLVALAPLYLIFFALHLIISRNIILGYFLLTLSLASLLMILNLDAATVLANFLGVGRATDLLVYVLFISMVFLSVSNLIRFRNTDRIITSLAREFALTTASKNSEKTD